MLSFASPPRPFSVTNMLINSFYFTITNQYVFILPGCFFFSFILTPFFLFSFFYVLNGFSADEGKDRGGKVDKEGGVDKGG